MAVKSFIVQSPGRKKSFLTFGPDWFESAEEARRWGQRGQVLQEHPEEVERQKDGEVPSRGPSQRTGEYQGDQMIWKKSPNFFEK